MAREIQLFKLPQELNDSVYVSEKYPILVDPTGQAGQFLKYRARYLSIMKKGDFEKDSLRAGFVQALHNGAWMCLDFAKLEVDLESLFDKDNFPAAVLSPHEVGLEETYAPCLRKSDNFTAKVTYEHSAAEAVGAFQDRTKAHAPERVADVDSRFEPKDGFRLIIMTQREEVPESLAAQMCVLKVVCSEAEIKNNAGTWAGGSRPKEEKSKEQRKMDEDLLELAFDGELDEVKALLEKGADPMARDGRENTPLAEAAVQGHLETVRYLLDWKAPIGSDPNAAGSDGRTPLHRSAFQGHHETVQLLLERGADPRIKDRSGELPFDMASNDETREALTSWDVTRTDALKEERAKAQDIEDEKHVKNDEERKMLAKRKKMQKMIEYAEAGEKDLLEMELMDIEPNQIGSYRDDRGNTVLHICAEHGRLDCIKFLLDEVKMAVNSRDSKGWTPIAVAAFHAQKKACQELMARKADPLIENAYKKSAFDVAKDDEIREVLKMTPLAAESGANASSSSTPGPAAEAEEEDAAPKGKKAKAKAKKGAAAGSGAAAAKELGAGAKAKAKAKSKKK